MGRKHWSEETHLIKWGKPVVIHQKWGLLFAKWRKEILQCWKYDLEISLRKVALYVKVVRRKFRLGVKYL